MCPVETNLKLLIVEDSEDDLLLMVREITRGGYRVDYRRIESEQEMRSELTRNDWDLIVVDYTLPHFSGLAALKVLNESGLDIPIIVVSGTITDETAVSAMRSGAKDYLMKNNLKRLLPAIEREISEKYDRAERRRIEESLRQHEEEQIRLKQESDAATKAFLRDTVYAVTDGRLRLVSYEEANELCSCGEAIIEIDAPDKIGTARSTVNNIAHGAHMADDRAHALVTAVGEASVNALKHGGGGILTICYLDGAVRACVRDHGEGIESLILPTATLMSRFSTKYSMGFGFALMLSSVDAVYLATGREGTSIILEKAVEETTSELSLAQLPDVW